MTAGIGSPADRLERVRSAGVIAVLRASTPEGALAAAEAILRGGITAIEVTYSVPGAVEVIRELSIRHGDRALIGAGTLTKEAQAGAAADAGADFLVSPGTLEGLALAMLETGRTTMTGALTPTEVMSALALGVDAVKIFPASLGGPAYLRALRGPFPDAPLMPTGGVTPENLGDWLAAGAAAVGAGGELANAASIEGADWQDLEDRARRFSAAGSRALRPASAASPPPPSAAPPAAGSAPA